MRWNLSLCCALTAGCVLLPAMARGSEPKLPLTISFALIDNRVFLPVTIDGQGPFSMVLDTGAGDGSSIDMAVYRRLSLPKQGEEQETGAGAGTEAAIDTHAKSLVLGPIELGSEPLVALSLKPIADTIGFTKFDGILGDALFRRYVVTLDFEHSRLILDDPAHYRPPTGATIVPFQIYHGFVPICDGSVDGISGKFLLDLGDRSSLTLYKSFWQANGFDKGVPTVAAMTGIGIGGPIRGLVRRIGSISLGGAQIENPVTRLLLQGASAIKEGSVAGSIGTGIFKRFATSFDYPHNRMILVPNALRNEPDLYDRAGLWLGRSSEGLKVLDVTGGGPADVAGIKPGDAVVSVDGRAALTIDLPALRDRMKEPKIIEVELVTERDGKRSGKLLVLKNLIPAATPPR